MPKRLTVVGLSLLTAATLVTRAEPNDLVQTVIDLRAAIESGDLVRARSFLVEDPRVWYGGRDGPGFAWTPGAGRWRTWDEHFNGQSTLGPWQQERNTVWAIAEETNDYFRLLEREDIPRYRISYFVDDAGRVEGYMISAAEPENVASPRRDRFEEFAAWAEAEHPKEWEYLRPGGELDPTGDRAPRTRSLLEAWRQAVGLRKLSL